MEDLNHGWFVAMAEQREGPMTQEDVEHLLSSGRAGPETLVWQRSLTDWTPAESVPLFDAVLTRDAPPPLPNAHDRQEEMSRIEEEPKGMRGKGQLEQEPPRLAEDSLDPTFEKEEETPTPLTGLGRKTVFGLYVMAGLSGIAAISSFGEFAFIQDVMAGGAFSDERAEAIDDRQGLIASLWFIGFLIVGILFIRWLRTAHDRAVAVDPKSVRYSKPWTIWGWIVPVVFLWIPFRIVKDSWRVLLRSERESAPGFMVGWWGLFLTMNALGYLSFQLISRDGLDLLLVGSATGMLSDVVAVPAALLAVKIVKEIERGVLSMAPAPLGPNLVSKPIGKRP